MREFYTVKEMAEKFGVHEHTIRNWIKKGQIRAVKIENTVRIPATEIERLKKADPTRQ